MEHKDSDQSAPYSPLCHYLMPDEENPLATQVLTSVFHLPLFVYFEEGGVHNSPPDAPW